MKSIFSARLFLGLAITAIAPSTPAQEVFHLNWQESGLHELKLGFRPHGLLLEAKAPEGLKPAPAGVTHPFYGVIELGPPKSAATIRVLVDVTNGAPARFFIDRDL